MIDERLALLSILFPIPVHHSLCQCQCKSSFVQNMRTDAMCILHTHSISFIQSILSNISKSISHKCVTSTTAFDSTSAAHHHTCFVNVGKKMPYHEILCQNIHSVNFIQFMLNADIKNNNQRIHCCCCCCCMNDSE